MALITLLDAQLAFGHVALLDHAGFSLETAERVGLIGRNGAGKSSLLKILGGLAKPDDGSLQVQQGVRIAFVAQEPTLDPSATIFKAASEGLQRVIAIRDQYLSGADGLDLDALQSMLADAQHVALTEAGAELAAASARQKGAPIEGLVMKEGGGWDMDAAAILLCESDGTPEEVEEEIGRMLAVLEGCGATRLQVSETEAQRLKFWSGRKNAFPASGRISPDYMCMDSTIPRKRLADILIAIAEMEKKYDLRCCNVFHAGDGNLHPLILFDANDPDQMHRCELFGADILETSVAMGGTVTGEHGVGIEKLSSMCVQFSPEEREQMFGVKRAFDPNGLLNPGKVIPTLNRCAEYGRMLVRGGQIKHPDLPRF